MTLPSEPIDVVFTWVDDSFPGYLEELGQYVSGTHDSNPNRTRDNIQTLRYAMRSIWRNMPEIRNIYLLSCRPQIPAWLNPDHPRIHVVHHDEIMDPAILPTFNSFAIVSHLHLLPGISQRFVYFEDDMLAMSPDLGNALFDDAGMPLLHLYWRKVKPLAELDASSESPWNLALANGAAVLDARFGAKTRHHIIHGPMVMDKSVCEAMCRDFPDLIATTRNARFRAGSNVPPEFLSLHLAVETGAARLAEDALSKQVQGYVSLENLALWSWFQLVRINRRRPLSVTLNDSFGDRPNPRVERMATRWLEQHFPDPAPWEYTA